MRHMGGLKEWMPSTYRTYLISTFAISGIPLFAGFFSKDEILFKAFEAGWNGLGLGYFVWLVGLVTAVLTAIYMMRSVMLTFHGEPRWPEAAHVHPHESGSTMTIPLWILAFGSVVGGFIGLPAVIAHGELNWIHHYLVEAGPVLEPHYGAHVPIPLEWGLIGLSSVLAIGGVTFAWHRYATYGLEYDDFLADRLGTVYQVWAGKYYWDEFYDRTIVRPTVGVSNQVLTFFDEWIVDGIVNGVARLATLLGRGMRYLQTGVVQTYAAALVIGVVLMLYLFVFL